MKRFVIQVISDSMDEDDVFVIGHPNDDASAQSAVDDIAGWLDKQEAFDYMEEGESPTLGEVLSLAHREVFRELMGAELGVAVDLLEIDMIEGYDTETSYSIGNKS